MTISSSSRNSSPIAGGRDEPSAPSPGLLLFNSEELSDIVFIVGVDSNTWRIPAHSFVVSGASRVFEEIVASRKVADNNVDVYSMDKKPEVAVYCQPDVFHSMLSFIYKNDANLNSIVSALTLIPVAHRFEMHDLIASCLSYLQQKACPENVLEILSFLRQYSAALSESCNKNKQPAFAASFPAPVYPSLENVMQGENLLNDLIAKCYAILDANAEDILTRAESIECMDQVLLMEIMNRDSLCLSSELVAFECLMTWSCQQCLKQRLPVTGENRRALLSEGVYSARYLIMSQEDFMKGPYTSDLLTDEEKTYLLTRLRGEVCDSIPKAMIGRKLDVPRFNPNRLPIRTPCDCKSKKRSAGDSGEPRKKSASKKLLNGLSGFMICVIQLLD